MKFFNIVLFYTFFSTTSFSQIEKPIDVQSVLAEISSNDKRAISAFEKLKAQDSLLEVLRIHFEYLSYNSKFALALQTKNKEDRILLYKNIRNYHYYVVKSPFYFYKFFNLYVDATRRLIYEYRGNLDELNRLTIVPSAFGELAQNLKIEIEFAGGTWTRGKIPIDPETTKKGNRYKKD